MPLHLVTGATGLLGSHIVEELVRTNQPVRALVRLSSDTTLLKPLGVELLAGDLQDRASLKRAADGVQIVYHCAAKVGDWGPWSAYQSQTIDATGNLVEACRQAGVERLLHVSSVAVYGHPQGEDRQFTEDEPLGQHLWMWDHYPRSKIGAEQEARKLGDRATIVRPSWIYGPRDRSVIPRIIKAIETGRISVVGDGNNLLNMVYASDVAQGAILAATQAQAAGRTYNLSSSGEITQRQLLDTLCDWLQHPRVTRQVRLRLAMRVGFVSELIGRAIRLKRAPYITRRGVSLISRPTRFSSQRARDELGWRQTVEVQDGLRRTLEWLRERSAVANAR